MNKTTQDPKQPTAQGVGVHTMVMCENCMDRHTDTELRNYRATTQDRIQANIKICKLCVEYLRKHDNVRLKLLHT